ncbi:MAG: hypothetical protein ACTSUB_10355 [Candidatus Thorarchaeota archaeon]
MITLNYQLQRFHDLDFLQHFMIIHKSSGACLFYHPFKEDEIKSDLIGGFISAMSSMYGEFTGQGQQEQIESLKYQGMTLSGFTGNETVGVLISEGTISTIFRLDDFIASFESRYDGALKNWFGRMNFLEPAWIVKNLYDAIGYSNNIPFTVSSQKPKKQYNKVIAFLQSRCNNQGRFTIRKVLMGLKKFLNISEPNTLDLIMMVKREGLISPIPVEDLLETTVKAGELLESMSSDGFVEAKLEGSLAELGELIDESETEDTERIETGEVVVEHSVSDTDEILIDASLDEAKLIDYGTYSLRQEVLLSDLIQHQGDEWIQDFVRDAITVHLGKRVVVSSPQYVPVGYDSEKGTVEIKITCNMKGLPVE